MIGKFVSFLSLGGRSPLSLAVEVLLLSTAASLPNCWPSSSSPPLRNRRCPLHCRRSYLSAPVANRRYHLLLDAASSFSLVAASYGFFLHQQSHHLAVTPVTAASVNRCHHQHRSFLCR
ncbi:hypothetical protein B296_00013429 [Ensete ventricosum]|uniref:Secreted protein n=1 Tax=Ensete ventricosum TaxID=4639 RepID=A0A427A1R2_ENSVE|nr:hypothetical protein B296_00013429 [Ensete ventricosum]